ncbi:hypothetical protein EF919_18105 [Streptomyces sp. WAC02707]|uniref:hypothetical protein n=1 Tax=Streptomyces sp. WAC02707 TaxID=2487417 RepID=UPI000F793AEB|nr:hypothetical protein [Streptomyces sp. WAC02707]RSS92448.1 hypothetical protein EF919_18105 [Streptomyces sp. WAC02707]
MGYRPKRRVYELDFTGTEWEGLEASVRGLTVGEELELNEMEWTPENTVKALVKRLVSWNVEDDDGPVPTTFEGVCRQDGAMVLAILNALRTVGSGVPDPLPQTSPDGEPSPAVPIPMAPLSESPEHSAVPA